VVVLAERNDCRSRRAARGPSRPRAKSTWITTKGLASQRESAARSERAPEAGSSVAKRRDRWRAPKPNKSPAKAGFRGATRRRKAPGIGAAGLLDGRAAKAVLAAIEGSASRRAHDGGDVGVRGHSPAPSGPKRPGWRGTATSVPDAATSERRRRGLHRERMGRSWSGAPSSAPSAGVGSSQDGLAPHGRNRPRSVKNSAVGAA